MERLSQLLLLLLEAHAGRRQWNASLSFQLSGTLPGTQVGSGHADVDLEGEDWLLAPHSLHSPIPSTVLGDTRTSGDVAQEAAARQSRCGCSPGGSIGPWLGTPGGATSNPGLQTQLCPHVVGALASGTLSLLCIVLIQSPVTELH